MAKYLVLKCFQHHGVEPENCWVLDEARVHMSAVFPIMLYFAVLKCYHHCWIFVYLFFYEGRGKVERAAFYLLQSAYGYLI